jgi:hypothetical protein
MAFVPKIPLGVRRNNPGNIDYDPNCIWVGQVEPHDGHRFCKFKSPEYGIRAMGKLLKNYYLYKKHTDGSRIDTVAKAIQRWAPPSENSTNVYASFVAQALGVTPNEPVDYTRPALLAKMVRAIMRFENGYDPYSGDIVAMGVALLSA